MGTTDSCPKTPLLHIDGERGFVFCGPRDCTSQKRMAPKLRTNQQTEPGAGNPLVVSGSFGLEGWPLCPGPNLFAKSRPHLKWLFRFVIGCVFVERSAGQAMEDQEEPFREHRGRPNEKLHPDRLQNPAPPSPGEPGFIFLSPYRRQRGALGAWRIQQSQLRPGGTFSRWRGRSCGRKRRG
jgi:hypothetical protein